jgi:hypothetical protein
MCQDALCFAKKIKFLELLIENEALIGNWAINAKRNKDPDWVYESVSNLIQQ